MAAQRTALCSQIRGALAEYGIVLLVTVPKLRRAPCRRAVLTAAGYLFLKGRVLGRTATNVIGNGIATVVAKWADTGVVDDAACLRGKLRRAVRARARHR